MRLLSLLAAVALTAGAAPTMSVEMIVRDGEAAKYWPRWRGPSYQGHVTGSGYPDTWSDTKNVRWKVPVPGTGNSSPIVWADQIVMATSYDGGQRKSIIAFSRTDGRKALGDVRAGRPARASRTRRTATPPARRRPTAGASTRISATTACSRST
jgi:hypothetical protein